MTHALATHELTKDYAVGFWRKRPYRALDRLTLDVERRRGLRLPRPERRRQDDDAEAADAAGVSDRRAAPRFSAARSAICRVKRRIGYLPENPYFYDYLTAEELLDVLRRRSSAIRGARARARAPAGCSTRSASAPSGACSCASSRRACCSASASRRRSSTIPSS